MWEHITYFLEGVIPVADKGGVRMALHPDDPPIPEPLGGVAQIVSTLRSVPADFRYCPIRFQRNAVLSGMRHRDGGECV